MPHPPLPPSALFDLTDRVAIVTGASSGLGRRFAEVLDAAGCHVVAVARRRDRLDELAAEHPRIRAFTADVTASASLQALVEFTAAEFGGIDILVNNAGLGNPRPAVAEDLESFRYTLEVNLVALFDLTRLVAPHMFDTGRGSVINIASILGLGSAWPVPSGAYTASKGAVIQLTRELACQWARRDVRVNAIAPGFFPSDTIDEAQLDEKSLDYMTRDAPMRRIGHEHELDGALVYLASSASSFVTGQTLIVDGGWTAH